MKFIRFGETLLNLEQVIYFFDSDGETGPTIYAYFNGPFPVRRECFADAEAMQARFKELSDYLVDEKHLTTKSGGEPKSRVMTASEAVNIPDIVGKRVMVEAVVEDIENYHPDNLFCVQLEFDFKHEKFTKWVHKSTLIEVID